MSLFIIIISIQCAYKCMHNITDNWLCTFVSIYEIQMLARPVAHNWRVGSGLTSEGDSLTLQYRARFDGQSHHWRVYKGNKKRRKLSKWPKSRSILCRNRFFKLHSSSIINWGFSIEKHAFMINKGNIRWTFKVTVAHFPIGTAGFLATQVKLRPLSVSDGVMGR